MSAEEPKAQLFLNKLLTLREVAVRLGVHYDTARDFVVSGELPGVRLGGRRKWQVLEDDLNGFIEASKCGPIPGPKPIEKQPKMAQNRRGRKSRESRPHEWRQQFRGK